MIYDAIIAGAGISGLTAAAYLCKDGCKVLLCEKEEHLGGLVGSFDFNGFVFDSGIRALENSGILFPMLKQLGIEMDFVKNNISIGIGDDVIGLISKDSLTDYRNLLIRHFPENKQDIEHIIDEIKRIMGYMDILYGIDNPLFLDFKKDKEYLYKTILPWLIKYTLTIKKIAKLNTPIEEYLKRFTCNQALIDLIAQHFFKETPAFFALSYFSLYLDYYYPKGGTGAIIEKLAELIKLNNGEIRTGTQITTINPQEKTAADAKGNVYRYKKLIWASDLKGLYNAVDCNALKDSKTVQKVLSKKNELTDKTGGDSILSLYITVKMEKSDIRKVCSEHFFCTPSNIGLSKADIGEIKCNSGFTDDKQCIINWLKSYYELTTFEISCPVLRDEHLAPYNEAGLIISTLMDYSLVLHIYNMGWYEEFKNISKDYIIDVLSKSIFKGINEKITDYFIATPLTIERKTGNTQGAITGWAFTNSPVPAVSNMPKIAQSVLTPIPDIFQAGQWTFSPSGLPISILTGKLAADKVKKKK